MALSNRDAITVHIAQDNPTADLDREFAAKAENARKRLTP